MKVLMYTWYIFSDIFCFMSEETAKMALFMYTWCCSGRRNKITKKWNNKNLEDQKNLSEKRRNH